LKPHQSFVNTLYKPVGQC